MEDQQKVVVLLEALLPFALAAEKVEKTIKQHQELGMGTLSNNASSGLGIKFGDILKARDVYNRLK